MTDDQAVLATFWAGAKIVIRAATAEDVPRLEWGGEFWHLRQYFERSFHEQQAGRRLLLVADAGGFPVGRLFLLLGAGNPHYADGATRAYLYSLHVLADWQRRGIGSHLLQTAERLLAARGFHWAVIAAAKTNRAARSLYERRGYRVFREDAGCWTYTDPDGCTHSVSEPCWVLQKNLRPAGAESPPEPPA